MKKQEIEEIDKLIWKRIKNKEDNYTRSNYYMAKVTGGWLFSSKYGGNSESLTFVPDPTRAMQKMYDNGI